MAIENKLFGKISYRNLFRTIWALVVVGLLLFAGLFVYVAKNKMPDTQELENPKFEQSSIVYSSNGEEIDRYFRRNRQWVGYDELSSNLVNALIATEDYRFYRHSGIDARGTARAVAFLGSRGGASTITQQLAKQFFTEKRSRNFAKRVWQKMQEWVIAVEFERRYTKEELLAMFLNKFDFRYQANGVGAAASIYFGKNQEELTIPEAALLVGMLKNPYLYSPISKKENALKRRNVVLSQMKKYDFITPEEYDLYRSEPIDMSNFNRGENFKGLAPHFMAELKKYVKDLLEEQNITKPGGAPYNLDTDGLIINTTIDSRYQRHAEAAARKHMTTVQNRFEQVWKNDDPWTYFDPSDDDLTKDVIARQKVVRNNELSKLIESSDRYVRLRFKVMKDISAAITKEIPDARLWNGDIKRMIQEEKEDGYLDEIIGKKWMSKEQKKVYQQIMASDHWPVLKEKYSELNELAKDEFNKRKRMTVYGYNGTEELMISPIDSIKRMASFMQIGSMSVDPKTGHVKTWIGGSDYDIWKYDHVRNARRQVGSTFKPFLYTSAILHKAFSPCHKVKDMQYIIPKGEFELSRNWAPKNSRGEFTDEDYTLKEALRLSLNSASVWLVKQLGSVDYIVDLAESMGITEDRIPRYPSIVLGSPTLSLFEMTEAYCTFANDGLTRDLIFVTSIEHNGVTIYEGHSSERRVLPENVNYAMVDILKHASSVVDYRLETEFGGKTGTTNDHVDGWYMGITPNLVTGTWVGGDYSWIRFLTLTDGQGGRMARPFFLDFMERIEQDNEIGFDKSARFPIPADMDITIDCEAYEPLYKEEVLDDWDVEINDDE